MYVYTHTHIYKYIYIHTHMYINIYMWSDYRLHPTYRLEVETSTKQ